jgi:opacity protein-like surface antigen
MKKIVLAAIAFVALPFSVHAQNMNNVYVGLRGGANWTLNTSANLNGSASVLGFGSGSLSGINNLNLQTGWAGGGFIGYDFVGPRAEIEALYRDNMGTESGTFPVSGVGTVRVNGYTQIRQTSVMANLYYDFFAHQTFTPYVGAGAGVAFIDTHMGGLTDSTDTEFAYQAIVGAGYKVTPRVRLNLDGRYYGTLNANVNDSFRSNQFTVPVSGNITGSYPNNNFSIMASVVFAFGSPSP